MLSNLYTMWRADQSPHTRTHTLGAAFPLTGILVNHSGYSWLPLSTTAYPLEDVRFRFWFREVMYTNGI